VFRLLLVVVGSGIGGGLRYLFGQWALRAFGPTFPFGTLGVNVIGSFLITVIVHLGLTRGLLSADVRLLLTTGLMGGFTTYSAFNYETMHFFQNGAYGMGLLYIGVTVVCCLLAALLATAALRWLG
jgi:fluoride exporter